MIEQTTLMQKIGPLLEAQGKVFKKNKRVLARPAKPGEAIVTMPADGVETANIARTGDYLIQNQTQAKEQYLVSKRKFHLRYEFVEEAEGEFAVYAPTARVVAIQIDKKILALLDQEGSFKIEAPWKTPQIVKPDDYFACPPDSSEIYRISYKEFHETFVLDEKS